MQFTSNIIALVLQSVFPEQLMQTEPDQIDDVAAANEYTRERTLDREETQTGQTHKRMTTMTSVNRLTKIQRAAKRRS